MIARSNPNRLLFALVIGCGLTAATPQGDNSSTAPRPSKHHKSTDLTVVSLKPGETYSLALKSLPSAGYSWTFEITGDKDSISVGWANLPPEPRPTTTNEPLRVGGRVDQSFLVKAISRGSASIRLVERRPWEKDQPPADERRLKIKVR